MREMTLSLGAFGLDWRKKGISPPPFKNWAHMGWMGIARENGRSFLGRPKRERRRKGEFLGGFEIMRVGKSREREEDF